MVEVTYSAYLSSYYHRNAILARFVAIVEISLSMHITFIEDTLRLNHMVWYKQDISVSPVTELRLAGRGKQTAAAREFIDKHLTTVRNFRRVANGIGDARYNTFAAIRVETITLGVEERAKSIQL